MTQRINYKTSSPGAFQAMLALEAHARQCGLEHSLLELVKTRVSQINGCAYCLDMHTKDARAAGVRAAGGDTAMTTDTVVEPADIKGKKLRTMQVPMHIAYWESIGAAPTPMAFPEVFTALQQGVVDGVENPFELMFSAKFTEPATKLTDLRWIYDPEVILMGHEAAIEELGELA